MSPIGDTPKTRSLLVDALKALASQFVVLHHLAFYGPMSDAIHEYAPGTLAWFSRNARVAVQVFLVTGGYLAARALLPSGEFGLASSLQALKNRTLRLAPSYAVALALAIIAAAFARLLMTNDSIPAPPTIPQVLAHVFLLQGILGVDSLSAGLWYIAIDFQLFALFLGMLVASRTLGKEDEQHARAWVDMFVAAGILASLFYFNRDPVFDGWAPYFFGAYGFGILAFRVAHSERKAPGLAFLVFASILALGVDFRSRIALASVAALALSAPVRRRLPENLRVVRVLRFFSEISYGVFLTHFPVMLVVGAVVTHFFQKDPGANAVGILSAWLVSIATGFALSRMP
ncbi:MAG: acyltransferase [Candidatus Accumulibacter sp.]|jgi:peptidoglycan/LPS O-acetylase OafA/YrhL|nr:acyltransferase [Accumulibacter sp.]